MQIKFITGRLYGDELIEEVVVDRETDKCVWINRRRCRKATHCQKYWDSWDAAHAYLVSQAEAALISAQDRLDLARNDLERIRALKNG